MRHSHSYESIFTFIAGFLSGLLVALAVTFIVMLATSGGYDQAGGPGYLESVFPVFRYCKQLAKLYTPRFDLQVLHQILHKRLIWSGRRTGATGVSAPIHSVPG
jgi:hypothetical protein